MRRCVGLLVRRSVQCIVENVGSNTDAVWHHRSDGSREEIGNGFGDRLSARGTFGGEFGARHCNQWGIYGVGVRQCLNRRSCCLGLCVRWAEVLLYYMGSTSCKGTGRFWGFVPHFHNGKCHWIADGEMFPIRMRKLDNSSVRQTYRWKARLVGFWRYIQFQDKLRFVRNSQKVTIVLRKLTMA